MRVFSILGSIFFAGCGPIRRRATVHFKAPPLPRFAPMVRDGLSVAAPEH
jgi:hypothetical protein